MAKAACTTAASGSDRRFGVYPLSGTHSRFPLKGSFKGFYRVYGIRVHGTHDVYTQAFKYLYRDPFTA